MDENLIINEKQRRMKVAALHARYLGCEVFIWQGERKGLLGKLEAFKIAKHPDYDGDGKLEKYDVKVTISGEKITMNGADQIILTDEAEPLDAFNG